MSIFSHLQNTFAHAQGLIAQAQGMAPSASGNFIGPDGHPYTMTFRAADAFEVQAVSREMTLHGYNDRGVMIATATRSQFTSTPLGWRRLKGSRLHPAPATEGMIASIGTDDPHHYTFTLLFRQPAT